MIEKIQFYISRDTDPYKNLATEKYLFDNCPQDTAILYLWQNLNTVVIGRNQNPWTECRCTLLEEEGGRLARRLSGGGAVFHDLGNLNFTFLCSDENYDLSRQLNVIREACLLAGIKTELSGRNDILADGRKFSGNAFYNSKGKSYHHGTILISADTEKLSRYLTPPKAKLEAKGVKSVVSRVINLSEINPALTCDKMSQYMLTAFEKVYSLPLKELPIGDTDTLLKLADKYSSWEYLFAPQPPFSVSCEGQFSFGHIELRLNVIKGIIESAQAYTDSMDWTLPDKIKEALTGCKFDSSSIKNALCRNLSDSLCQDILELLQKEIL